MVTECMRRGPAGQLREMVTACMRCGPAFRPLSAALISRERVLGCGVSGWHKYNATVWVNQVSQDPLSKPDGTVSLL